MHFEHDFTVPATVDQSWAAFNHLELIGSCFPGMTLTSVDDHDFAGVLKVKLGTVPLVYTGTGRYTERHLGGRHLVIEATGIDGRGKGTASVKLRLSFSMAGEQTLVRVASDVDFTGQPTHFDQSLVADAAERLVARFADAVASRFRAGLGAEALRADSNARYASDLGSAASSRPTTYTYNPPKVASQNDYEALRAAVPVWASRLAGPLLGSLALAWMARRAQQTVRARRQDSPQD